MDPARAKAMIRELNGQSISGWLVKDYIDRGKSALVLRAEKENQLGAIKVFDRELIERYGRDVQAERIRRELSLVGKKHPHLIEILDGGYWAPFDVHFIVMNFFPGTNLAKVRGKVPFENIRALISQVAAAAQFLEQLGLVHRDIKPENIGIDLEFQRAVLLDLGVIRPVGVDPITDDDAMKHFIGTLQYSSPEFLRREEVDSVEGWRTLTFYQLGGVLHDLITRRALFGEFLSPFVKLSNAVQDEQPRIESNDAPRDLVELARHCLVKDPRLRLSLVQWEDFDANPPVIPPVAAIKERMAKRRLHATAAFGRAEPPIDQERATLAWKINDYANQVQSIFRHECIGNPDFPPITVADATAPESHATRFTVSFDPSPEHGLNTYLQIAVQLRWVDLTDDVVSLDGSALTAPRALLPADFDDANDVRLYQGRFDPESIAARLIPMLYSVFEKAQTLSETAIDSDAGIQSKVTVLPLDDPGEERI